MAESKHWQIAEALRTTLAEIVGDAGATYWYTPDAVVICDVWDGVADPSVGAEVMAIRPGEESHSEETPGTLRATAEFFVLLLRKTTATDPSPYQSDGGLRLKEKNRVIRDFLRALWEDVTLGGLVDNVNADSLYVNRDMGVDGDQWVAAEARFTVTYSYPKETP